MSACGALLFGRYAFPPNSRGYCGPPDHMALLERVASGSSDQGLVELERRFEGAYPYLALIARANGIDDPFDERVVDAYWIGNRYLERVEASSFYESLKERFKARMDPRSFHWLTTKLDLMARPHHNFHVLEVYKRAGLTRDSEAEITLERMDACRISWGEVMAVEKGCLVVARRALRLRGGKLVLGHPEVTQVAYELNGHSFVRQVAPGSVVSIHWNWACDTLTPGSLRRLRQRTAQYLRLANGTL